MRLNALIAGLIIASGATGIAAAQTMVSTSKDGDPFLTGTPIFADSFEFGNTGEWSSTILDFVTETPYADPEQIEYAGRTFCRDGTCPWGPGMHDGIDFVTAVDLIPFRSACDGTVSSMASFITGAGNRQVNVLIELAGLPGFGLVYAFEPMTQDVGNLQEANIEVEQGEEIAAGDLIGRLVMSPAVGSHVHWGVVSNHQQVCPRPYLADSVESSLLALIREDIPSGQICY
jgi:hypothetical protein